MFIAVFVLVLCIFGIGFIGMAIDDHNKNKPPKKNNLIYKCWSSMIGYHEKDPSLKLTLKREELLKQKDHIAPEQFEELLTRYDNLKK